MGRPKQQTKQTKHHTNINKTDKPLRGAVRQTIEFFEIVEATNNVVGLTHTDFDPAVLLKDVAIYLGRTSNLWENPLFGQSLTEDLAILVKGVAQKMLQRRQR